MRRWLTFITVTCCLGLLFLLPSQAAGTVWDGSEADAFAGGSGTEADPYLIADGAQLAHIGGSGYYKLTADIWLNDTAGWENWTAESSPANMWTPLGQNNQFSGVLDGDGYTIYGLYIVNTSDQTGLFKQIWDGTVRNLSIERSVVIGVHSVGTFAGTSSYSTFLNCHSGGIVIATGSSIGGIVGQLSDGVVSDCTNSGEIRNINEDHALIPYATQTGGLLGSAGRSSIQNCTNTGAVSSYSSQTGGVIGNIWSDSMVSAAKNYGTVTVFSSPENINSAIGGIAGVLHDNAVVTGCQNHGGLQTQTNKVGGIAGQISDTGRIANSINYALITGNTFIGGITGDTRGTVDSCQNQGNIAGTGDSCGGIAGEVQRGSLSNSSNSGEVSCAQNNCGGIAGGVYSEASGIFNCRNTGAITSVNTSGGICGCANNSGSTKIMNCWSSGMISQTNEYGNEGSIVGRPINCTVSHCYYLTGTCANMTDVTGSMEEISEETLRSAAFLSSLNGWVTENQRPATGYTSWEPDADGYPAPTGAVPAYTSVEGRLTLQMTEHGTAALSAERAMTEAPITVTLTPETGYIPYQVWYQSAEEPETKVYAAKDNNTFTFSMPYGDADVYASFLALPDNPAWDGTTAEEFAGGDGSENNPFLIGNGSQLARMELDPWQTYHYRLIADIVLNDTANWESWTRQSGPAHPWVPISRLSGTLDGDGHTISGLYVSSGQDEYGGLLRQIPNHGCVKNLTIEKSQVFGTEYVGMIAASNFGTISKCSSSGMIQATGNCCGGIAGRSENSEAVIEECVNTGAVTSGFINAGGIVGRSSGTLRNCVNRGDVTSTLTVYPDGSHRSLPVAGITGQASGTISNCRNYGSVTGYRDVAGITAHFHDGILENCTNYGTILSQRTEASDRSGRNAAGIVGTVWADAVLRNCVNEGAVSGWEHVGGICGFLGDEGKRGTVQIIGCVNNGTINAESRDAGGIAGFLYSCGGTTGILEQCANTGAVSIGTGSDCEMSGGIAGYCQAEDGGSATIRDCYNTGSVTGNRCVAGVTGYLRTKETGGSCLVENCYSTGTLSGNQRVSGTVPYLNARAGSVTVRNCYCLDSSSAEVAKSGSAGMETVSSVSSLTSAQMGQAGSFAGFDFDAVWASAGDGTYPTLQMLRTVKATGQMGELITYTEYVTGDLLVEAPADMDAPVKVIEVSYEDGRMVDCRMVELAPGQSAELRLRDQGDSVRLFLATEQLRPLCEAVNME